MSGEPAEDDILSRPQNEGNIARQKYNVFLCYNTVSEEDKSLVKAIGKQLKERGIVPWLDDWEVRPGTRWQREIGMQIKYIPAAAVFVGQGGIGPWQLLETEALLRELVERDCPVIPVHLPNASSKPELPNLLKGIRDIKWVDFQDLDADEDPLDSLIWGITGKRVKTHQPVRGMETRRSSHVLIASLGVSPVAITAMYDLLMERERLTIDQVIVLRPMGEDVGRTYELVREALTNACELQSKILPLENTNNWRDACIFLKELYMLLDTCQVRGDAVCLSLAGCGKSVVALMSSITSLFSCIEHLYHIINHNEEHFPSIDELELDMTPLHRKSAMHPDLEQLTLIDIPIEPRQQMNKQLITLLLSATEDELARLQDDVEKVAFVRAIAQGGKILEALVTEHVMKQFHSIRQHSRKTARHVRDCLEHMQSTVELLNIQPDSYLYKPAKSSAVYLHSFTSLNTSVHPVFYTRPKDIYVNLDEEVEQVVICELDNKKDSNNRSLQNIVASPDFSIKPAYYIDVLPSVPVDSVLIVPLDKTSMFPTQLYTLLKHREDRDIHHVILVYPAKAAEISERAKLIRRALRQEAKVQCTYAVVSGLNEIDSSDAYRRYQTTLESIIDQTRGDYPDCTVDLALSGRQEGVIAMTIFAAQNKHLPYVYHMQITDEQLNMAIDQQMTIEALTNPSLSSKERNDRLFLRAYEEEGVYTKFVLFKIPVFST